MRIYLKENKIFDKVFYKDDSNQLSEYDFEIDEFYKKKNIDIILGENGVGKSFFVQVLCLVGTVYCCYHNKQFGLLRTQLNTAINVLDELEIGVIKEEKELTEEDKKCILIETSINSRRKEKGNEYITIIDDDNEKIKIPHLNRYFYCINIGPIARSFFERYKLLYYTNSQFPNSNTIFTPNVISIKYDDIDKFLLLSCNHRIFDNLGKVTLEISLNKTNPFFDLKQEWANILDYSFIKNVANYFMKDYLVLPIYYNKLKYFAYPNLNESKCNQDKEKFIRNKIKKSITYKEIDKWINDKNYENIRFPFYNIDAKNFTIYDYFLTELMKKRHFVFDLSLKIDDIKIEKLNSGKQYSIAIECLKNFFKDKKENIILFIDEPENAHHIKLQEELAKKIKSRNHLVLITHSPFLVRGLKKFIQNGNITLIRKSDKNKRNLIVDEEIINYDDLNDITAEYFAYSPSIEEWNEKHPQCIQNNMITSYNFIKQLKALLDGDH